MLLATVAGTAVSLLLLGLADSLETLFAARILDGLTGGNLSVGSCADICIFDETTEWVVTSKTLASQGDNTPFLNHPMQGRVRYTLIDGHIDFEPQH